MYLKVIHCEMNKDSTLHIANGTYNLRKLKNGQKYAHKKKRKKKRKTLYCASHAVDMYSSKI
jgi:hypothetical protein